MKKTIRKPSESPDCLTKKIQEQKTENWKKEIEKYNNLSPEDKRKTKTPHFSLNSYKTLYSCLKENLLKMTDEHCSFCDTNFRKNERTEIEHFKPSSKYFDDVLEWSNLYIICSTCNGKKGNRYEKYIPLIKPDEENYKFEDYFKFEFAEATDGIKIKAKGENKKAQNIIKIYDLNRENLCYDRQETLDDYENRVKDKITISELNKEVKSQNPLELLENSKSIINEVTDKQIIELSEKDYSQININNFSFRDLLEKQNKYSDYEFKITKQ